MPESLPELLDHRGELLRQLSHLGDLQPGSITSVTRRCGKPNCRCAKPKQPGHDQVLLTSKRDGRTVTHSLSSPAAVHKAEREIGEYRRFRVMSQNLIDVSQKICHLRPVEENEGSAQEKKRQKPSSKK
jgi:hypothetical protein